MAVKLAGNQVIRESVIRWMTMVIALITMVIKTFNYQTSNYLFPWYGGFFPDTEPVSGKHVAYQGLVQLLIYQIALIA